MGDLLPVLDPGHLELDAFLAGIGIQNVLERLGPADANDRHCCLRGCLAVLVRHQE
jgi:hypothetical protein